MIETIERMLTDLERGKLTRRQIAVALASAAAATFATPCALDAQEKPNGFRAVSLNHVTVRVPDLHRTSQFYQEFFRMPLRQQAAKVHVLGVDRPSSALNKAKIRLLRSITSISGL